MSQQTISFDCKHPQCAQDSRNYTTIDIPKHDNSAGRPKKSKLVYCKRNHASTIQIPVTWDVVRPVLGDTPPSAPSDLPPFDADLSPNDSPPGN